MPEVIEIRKYADFLKKHLKNKKILEINILKGRYKNHSPFEKYYSIKKKLPLKVIDIVTKGKFLYFILENNYYIFSTLGLHGGWTWSKDRIKFKFNDMLNYVSTEKIDGYYKVALNNLNVEFKTVNGSIYYFDSLSFGTIKIINNIDELNKKLNSIGFDIMDESTTEEIFINKLREKKILQNKPIGNILLNQKIISGIGNYLRADVLWISKISPFRKLKNILDKELQTIFNNLKALTWNSYNRKKGIKLGYITKKSMLPLDYNIDFFVYNSDKDIYGNDVIKEELFEGSMKRFIYWVKKIQI
jgi:formamidopyrimidine-DNA glycosylase